MSDQTAQPAPIAESQGPAGGELPEPSTLRTRVVPIVAIAFVAGLLGLLAWSLFAPDSARRESDCRYTASRICEVRDPKPARDFALELRDGGTFRLADQRGKIVVLNFWASWCGPCREETPLLESAWRTLGDDVVLLGINIQDSEDNARAFVEEFGVTYPVTRPEGDAVSVDYGVTGVPETFVIDAEGRLVAHMEGPITSLAQLREMVALAR